MAEELFRLTQAETGILSQDAYPDLSGTYPLYTELYRYQVPVDRRISFKPGHTFSIYAMKLSDQPVGGAIADDNGTYTAETSEANEATNDDMTLTPAGPVAAQDNYYIGYTYPFSGLTLKYATLMADGTFVTRWEYRTSGGAWATLGGVTDGTGYFITDGSGAAGLDVTWTMPGDWVQYAVDGITLFWVRAYTVTSAGTNQATGDRCWIHPDPTVLDNKDMFRIEVRDQNELVRKPLINGTQYRQCNEFTDRDLIRRLDINSEVIAKPNDWIVISVKATAPVDVSGCYFILTADRDMVHIF